MCCKLLEKLETHHGGPLYSGGSVVLQMGQYGQTEEEFAENLRDYLLRCIPRQCKYLPRSGAGGPTRLVDVIDFFGILVRSKRCVFLLNDAWPKRIKNWPNWQSSQTSGGSGASCASVVQVPLSSICGPESGGDGDVAAVTAVKRSINELNKYIPICLSDDAKHLYICPLFFDHAKSSPALENNLRALRLAPLQTVTPQQQLLTVSSP